MPFVYVVSHTPNQQLISFFYQPYKTPDDYFPTGSVLQNHVTEEWLIRYLFLECLNVQQAIGKAVHLMMEVLI